MFFPLATNLQDFNSAEDPTLKMYFFFCYLNASVLIVQGKSGKTKFCCHFPQWCQTAGGHARPTLCTSYLNVTTGRACNEKCLWLTVSSFCWLFQTSCLREEHFEIWVSYEHVFLFAWLVVFQHGLLFFNPLRFLEWIYCAMMPKSVLLSSHSGSMGK